MRAILGWLVPVLLLSACGGSPSGASPNSAANDADRPTKAKAHAESGAADDATDASEPTEANRGPSCDDGTCSRCGNGICPSGWYCDEKAGGSCSWLAECAEKPSCGCITRVLGSACKCEASGGGLKVACD